MTIIGYYYPEIPNLSIWKRLINYVQSYFSKPKRYPYEEMSSIWEEMASKAGGLENKINSTYPPRRSTRRDYSTIFSDFLNAYKLDEYMNISSFCREHKIAKSTFYDHIRKRGIVLNRYKGPRDSKGRFVSSIIKYNDIREAV